MRLVEHSHLRTRQGSRVPLLPLSPEIHKGIPSLCRNRDRFVALRSRTLLVAASKVGSLTFLSSIILNSYEHRDES